jgi:hypothetical protein
MRPRAGSPDRPLPHYNADLGQPADVAFIEAIGGRRHV